MSKSETPQDPWYANGLKFQCTGCGDCCTGAPGFVWVNEAEIVAIAKAINEPDLDRFKKHYVRQVGVRRSLVELPSGDCIFFDNRSRKCTVYDARPRQCRTWPFWDSNVKTPETWEQTCAECPGSGRGKLHTLEQIEVQRKEFLL